MIIFIISILLHLRRYEIHCHRMEIVVIYNTGVYRPQLRQHIFLVEFIGLGASFFSNFVSIQEIRLQPYVVIPVCRDFIRTACSSLTYICHRLFDPAAAGFDNGCFTSVFLVKICAVIVRILIFGRIRFICVFISSRNIMVDAISFASHLCRRDERYYVDRVDHVMYAEVLFRIFLLCRIRSAFRSLARIREYLVTPAVFVTCVFLHDTLCRQICRSSRTGEAAYPEHQIAGFSLFFQFIVSDIFIYLFCYFVRRLGKSLRLFVRDCSRLAEGHVACPLSLIASASHSYRYEYLPGLVSACLRKLFASDRYSDRIQSRLAHHAFIHIYVPVRAADISKKLPRARMLVIVYVSVRVLFIELP